VAPLLTLPLQRAGRSFPLPLPLPPVQLPVSGRTLGRHVSLGPGWEMNREDQLLSPQHDYDQPSTSQAMLPPEASPRASCTPCSLC
jgi:hypothetical protein